VPSRRRDGVIGSRPQSPALALSRTER
jgi:hypothetical protein